MGSNSLAGSGLVVADLRRMLTSGTLNLASVPLLVKEVIRGDMWRERIEPGSGERVGFKTFAEFVVTPPLAGLGAEMVTLKRVCADDADALALLHDATTGDHGGDHRSDDFKSSNATLEKDRGRAHTVARLARQRPDLYERVKEGNLSAHAAAIEAGWRKSTLTVPSDVPALARVLRRRLAPADLAALIAALKEGEGA